MTRTRSNLASALLVVLLMLVASVQPEGVCVRTWTACTHACMHASHACRFGLRMSCGRPACLRILALCDKYGISGQGNTHERRFGKSEIRRQRRSFIVRMYERAYPSFMYRKTPFLRCRRIRNGYILVSDLYNASGCLNRTGGPAIYRCKSAALSPQLRSCICTPSNRDPHGNSKLMRPCAAAKIPHVEVHLLRVMMTSHAA